MCVRVCTRVCVVMRYVPPISFFRTNIRNTFVCRRCQREPQVTADRKPPPPWRKADFQGAQRVGGAELGGNRGAARPVPCTETRHQTQPPVASRAGKGTCKRDFPSLDVVRQDELALASPARNLESVLRSGRAWASDGACGKEASPLAAWRGQSAPFKDAGAASRGPSGSFSPYLPGPGLSRGQMRHERKDLVHPPLHALLISSEPNFRFP